MGLSSFRGLENVPFPEISSFVCRKFGDVESSRIRLFPWGHIRFLEQSNTNAEVSDKDRALLRRAAWLRRAPLGSAALRGHWPAPALACEVLCPQRQEGRGEGAREPLPGGPRRGGGGRPRAGRVGQRMSDAMSRRAFVGRMSCRAVEFEGCMRATCMFGRWFSWVARLYGFPAGRPELHGASQAHSTLR